jgi:Fic family protein
MIGLETIRITPDLLTRICAVDEFKGMWAALDDHTTGLNLIGDVAAHGEKFKKIWEPLQARDVTIQVVQALHMTVSRADDRGQLRSGDVLLEFEKDGQSVGSLETSAAEDIEPLLIKLLDWVNDALLSGRQHPLIVIAVFAAVFLQIAPFSDANMRLVRMVVILLMLKAGYRYAPFVPLDNIMQAEANGLYIALKRNQESLEAGAPEWADWLHAFFGVLCAQKDVLYGRIYDEEKTEQIADMPELSVKLLEALKAKKRMTMREAIKETKGRRSTIKLRMQELIEAKLVKRHGGGRSVWYSLV